MQVQAVLGRTGLDHLERMLMHDQLFIALPGVEFDPTAEFVGAGFITEAMLRLTQMRVEHRVRNSTGATSASAC